jgi:hypothetical protein
MKRMAYLLEFQHSMLLSVAAEEDKLSTELTADALEEARVVCLCKLRPE